MNVIEEERLERPESRTGARFILTKYLRKLRGRIKARLGCLAIEEALVCGFGMLRDDFAYKVPLPMSKPDITI